MTCMNQASKGRLRPWSHRAFDRSPFSLFWSAALLAVGFVLVFLFMELVLGRFVEYEVETYREDLRVAFVLCLWAAYLPAASIYLVESARRAANELKSVLEPAREMPDLEMAGEYDRSRLRRAGAVGVCVQFVTMVLVELDPSDLAALGQMSPEAYFHRLILIWIGWFVGRVAYSTWTESRRFSKIGRERVKLDLLDLGVVEPLSRFGLRQALVTIGLFSVILPMFYDADAAPNLFWILMVIAFLTLSLAAASLLIPVRGVRYAIAREKARELARVNGQIRMALAGSDSPTRPGLADWVAYRGLIESVREWPIDAPTLRRFALYLAIPLLSWFGGALVERMVDSLLD
jgi:hypothetical protein